MIKAITVEQCSKDLLVKRLDIGQYFIYSQKQSVDKLKNHELVWLKDTGDNTLLAPVQSVSKEFSRYIVKFGGMK